MALGDAEYTELAVATIGQAADHAGAVGAVWEEFTRDARHAKQVGLFAKLARAKDAAKRVLGATVLVHLTTSSVIKDATAKAAAAKEIETLWADPEQAATLLGVIGATGAKQFGPQVREHLHDKSSVVAEAAEFALTKLGLDKVAAPGARTIGEMKYEDVVKTALAVKGDAARGQALFLQQACAACHTVSESEPPKGPMLGGIATRYTRAELCESILRPGAKVSQGFETVWFKLKNKDEVEGFVVKESGDSVEVRNIAGVTRVLEKGAIAERQKTGPFKSIEDFCSRLDSRTVNRKILESLVKCGAFDGIDKNRAALFSCIESAIASAASIQRDRAKWKIVIDASNIRAE